MWVCRCSQEAIPMWVGQCGRMDKDACLKINLRCLAYLKDNGNVLPTPCPPVLAGEQQVHNAHLLLHSQTQCPCSVHRCKGASFIFDNVKGLQSTSPSVAENSRVNCRPKVCSKYFGPDSGPSSPSANPEHLHGGRWNHSRFVLVLLRERSGSVSTRH